MAQCIKVFATKPDDLSLVPGTHLFGRAKQTHRICLVTSTCMLWHMCT